MDQRVDNERRSEAAPGETAKPAGGAARAEDRSWRETLRERRGLVIAIALVIVVLLRGDLLWWLHARRYETTDDAFIDARTVQISPQISAAIVDVPVTDNQSSRPAPCWSGSTTAISGAARSGQGQVDQRKPSVDNLIAQIDAQQAKIEQAKKQVDAGAGGARPSRSSNRTLSDTGQARLAPSSRRSNNSNLAAKQASLAAAQANAVATKNRSRCWRRSDAHPAQLDQTRSASRPKPICRAPSSRRRWPAA